MPVKFIDLTSAPGFLVVVCPSCGAERTVNLNRGAAETRRGPFALGVGDGLQLQVDGHPAEVVFAADDFPDFAAVTAGQLAAKLGAALSGVTVSVHVSPAGESILVESQTTGAASRIEFIGGSARDALGLLAVDLCADRPVLGISTGGLKNKDAIAFRRCACGANELVLRTWDAAPAGLDGLAFSEQRKAVNALAQYFKEQGWIHPDVQAEVSAESGVPPDIAHGLPAVVLTPALPGPPLFGQPSGGS